MTIKCYDLVQFLDTIAGLVQRGLTFRSEVGSDFWHIELTGGF
jgi:hypothetical protein